MPDNQSTLEPRYYPALNNLITLDSIPDSLDFVQNISDNLFKKIFYKDFQSTVSRDGSQAFYSLKIVKKGRLDFDLFFGIKFILNRNIDDTAISSFPVVVQYNWPIIAYLKAFDLQDFSFTPREFYEMGLIVFNISAFSALRSVRKNLVALLT